MKRTIIRIDEDLCNGCGACVEGCHEGALQMIDGKARIISELYCDGLGACISECPVGAISLEEREAEPYNELITLQRMIIPKGEKTILAHLKHLKNQGEFGYLQEAVRFLKMNDVKVNFAEVHAMPSAAHSQKSSGCPGSQERNFVPAPAVKSFNAPGRIPVGLVEKKTQLRQWPVQLHLVNPQASFLKEADLVFAADCVPFSFPDFHERFLAGKALAIACPKLDSNKDIYLEKLRSMIVDSGIKSIHVVIMEVPCCGGMLQLAKRAVLESGRTIPVRLSVVGIQGDVIREEWV